MNEYELQTLVHEPDAQLCKALSLHTDYVNLGARKVECIFSGYSQWQGWVCGRSVEG